MNDKLKETLNKKAYGFYYDEEQCDYDLVPAKKFLFCKNKNNLYFENGFLKIKLLKQFSDSARISCKSNIRFCKKKSILKSIGKKPYVQRQDNICN